MRTKLMKPLMAAMCVALSTSVWAGPLEDGFYAAKGVDSLFLSASPEKDSNEMQALMARAAYLPTVQAQQSQYQATVSSSRTISITQPILSVEKAATFMEGTPRYKLAGIVFAQREADLAVRYFKAVSDWLKASEGLRLVQAKKEAFNQQYIAAKRSLEEGVGTVSDRQDSLLRLEQAKSEELSLKAQQSAAANAVRMISGNLPDEKLASRLTNRTLAPSIASQEDCLEQALKNNLALAQSRVEQELADLGVWKARGALSPQVSFVVANTTVNNANTNYTGIQLSMPLQAGSVGQAFTAKSIAEKQKMVTQDVENKVWLDVTRLHSLVTTGVAELAVRSSAVDTASLGVEANQKSFKGGVRSKTDVLNSIQAMYQTQQDLLYSRLALAENFLNLKLQEAQNPGDTLKEIDNFLFASK